MKAGFTLPLIGLVMLASACSPKSDHDVITAACVKDGATEGYCSCIAGTMKENLSPKVYARLVHLMRDEHRTREEAEDALDADEQSELLVIFPLTFECAAAE